MVWISVWLTGSSSASIFSDRCMKIMEGGAAAMPAGFDWVGWDLYYAPLPKNVIAMCEKLIATINV